MSLTLRIRSGGLLYFILGDPSAWRYGDTVICDRFRFGKTHAWWGDYGLLQMRHAPEDSLAQGIRMNYIGVQAQPSLRYFHIDHFNSDIYTAPENALGCVLEFNIARSAADGLSFHCRFDPTRIALNDVQLCWRATRTASLIWMRLCQHSATLTGAPTLWTL